MGDHHRNTRRTSWLCTVATQAILCLGLYAAFSIGRPQPLNRSSSSSINNTRRRDPLDFYFLSIRGGFWPSDLQIKLLQQMEEAVKIYNAKFVINISELGEDDPLSKNATLAFPFLQIPWYTTASHGHAKFLKKIKMPYGQVLEIVVVHSGSLQLNKTENAQLQWLQRVLAMSESNWRIVIGFDSLISCKEDDTKKPLVIYEPLQNIFIKYGVNAYLSQESCAGPHYVDEDIAFIGNPGPSNKDQRSFSINKNLEVRSKMGNGFLLHRVSPLEIESYFIETTGRVVSNSIIHQQGRGVL